MLEPLQRLFLREKPVLAILAVGEMEPAYAAMIAKRIDSTFPHTSSILSELEAQGLIKSRPDGRIRYLELTDRGKKLPRPLPNWLICCKSRMLNGRSWRGSGRWQPRQKGQMLLFALDLCAGIWRN